MEKLVSTITPQPSNLWRFTIPASHRRAIGLQDQMEVDFRFEDKNGRKAHARGERTTSGCEVIVKSSAARLLMQHGRPLRLTITAVR